jgi:hypothetical protein
MLDSAANYSGRSLSNTAPAMYFDELPITRVHDSSRKGGVVRMISYAFGLNDSPDRVPGRAGGERCNDLVQLWNGFRTEESGG